MYLKRMTAVFFTAALVFQCVAARAAEEINPVLKTTLENGLTVITREIHTAPVVFFSVWYRVGSRNEFSGETGISHALEHMMFKGTAGYPQPGETDEIVRRIGGVGNAGTSTDYTVYYETVPAGMENVVIGIEADRMAGALLRAQDFESEREVIMEERMMRNEDSPTGLLWEEINAAAFKVHPYGWPIIGWMEDIKALDTEKLREYYESHYAPDNAVVVVCGDFDTESLLEKVGNAFGGIPAAENRKPGPELVEPPQRVSKRIVFPSDKSNLAHVVYTWHAPTYGNEDSPALEIIDSILSSGRESRLSKTFIDGGLAGSVDAVHDTNTDPYLFYINVEVRPGVDTDTVENALDETVSSLKSEPVSDYELQKAKNRFRAEHVLDTQSTTSYGRMMGWFEISTGDPEFWDKYLDEIDAVTAEDIMRVAGEYLVDTNRTVGVLIPQGGPRTGSSGVHPGPAKEYGYTDAGTHELPAVEPGEIELDDFPSIDFSSRVKRVVLENGLVLLVYENHAFPSVSIEGRIRGGGSYSDPPGKEGLAKLVTRMIRRGTENRSYEEINRELEFVGASIEFNSGNETLVFGGEFLKKDFSMGVDLLADMLLNPSFPGDALEVERGVALAEHAAEQKNNRRRAWNAYMDLFYQGHPYSNPVSGTEEGIDSITREDLVGFHERVYRPDRTMIAFVGDIDTDEAVELARKYLGGWGAPDSKPFSPPPPPTVKELRKKEVEMPEKMQGVFYVGFPAPLPDSDDYEAFDMMADILAGSDLTSRLYRAVRKEEGLVYYVFGFDLPKTVSSSFQITAGTTPQNFLKTLDLILGEIRRIQTEPVGEKELTDAKSFAVGHLPMSIETNEAIASTMLDFEYNGRPFEDIDNYADTIRGITAQDIMDAANKYLDPKKYILGVAGPRIPAGQ